jgi:hypothetical protein
VLSRADAHGPAASALVAAPALAQQATTRGAYDPAAWGALTAVGVLDAGASRVVVRSPGAPPATFPDARSPALDGGLLAYADPAGIRVVRWRTGEQVTRIDGPLTKPALDWPYLAYVRTGRGQSLELVHLVTGRTRLVARTAPSVDLGRPALRAGFIAWHVAAGRRSLLRLARVKGYRYGRSRLIASSVSGLQVNPSIASGRILWVEQQASSSHLRLRRISGGRTRTLASLRGPSRILWTTALGGRAAYVTRWNPAAGRAEVISRRWR